MRKRSRRAFPRTEAPPNHAKKILLITPRNENTRAPMTDARISHVLSHEFKRKAGKEFRGRIIHWTAISRQAYSDGWGHGRSQNDESY